MLITYMKRNWYKHSINTFSLNGSWQTKISRFKHMITFRSAFDCTNWTSCKITEIVLKFRRKNIFMNKGEILAHQSSKVICLKFSWLYFSCYLKYVKKKGFITKVMEVFLVYLHAEISNIPWWCPKGNQRLTFTHVKTIVKKDLHFPSFVQTSNCITVLWNLVTNFINRV